METHRTQSGYLSHFREMDGGRKAEKTMQLRHFVGKLVPAPGLEGVAGSLVEVSLHGDPVSPVGVEIHDGVIIGDVLDNVKEKQVVSQK